MPSADQIQEVSRWAKGNVEGVSKGHRECQTMRPIVWESPQNGLQADHFSTFVFRYFQPSHEICFTPSRLIPPSPRFQRRTLGSQRRRMIV